MKRHITRIGPHQAGKVGAILYFVMGCLLVPFMLIPMLMGGDRAGPGVLFVLAMPILYCVLGYVFVVLMSWMYNVVASFVGGIEITLDEPPVQAAEAP